MKQQEPTPRKKKYRKPEVREYGDVRSLTENVIGGTGALDGGFYFGIPLKTAG